MHYIVLQIQFSMITACFLQIHKKCCLQGSYYQIKIKKIDCFLLSEQPAALLFIQYTSFVVSSRQKPVADCFCSQKRCSSEEGDALPSEDLFI